MRQRSSLTNASSGGEGPTIASQVRHCLSVTSAKRVTNAASNPPPDPRPRNVAATAPSSRVSGLMADQAPAWRCPYCGFASLTSDDRCGRVCAGSWGRLPTLAHIADRPAESGAAMNRERLAQIIAEVSGQYRKGEEIVRERRGAVDVTHVYLMPPVAEMPDGW